MPSNIAHMLICHKAINRLHFLRQDVKGRRGKHFESFLSILESDATGEGGNCLRAFFNLGSLGPDLFCYKDFHQMAAVILGVGSPGAVGPEPFAYHCHSSRPNEFPLKLLEIFFRDLPTGPDGAFSENDLEFQDRAKLAFTAGYLTHIAADQVLHPLVNRYAKPYYRSAPNRDRHRDCEVQQDYFLFNYVYDLEGKKHDFFDMEFGTWIDCIEGLDSSNRADMLKALGRIIMSGGDLDIGAAGATAAVGSLSGLITESISKTLGIKTRQPEYRLADWFESFIQRAFAETYGITPPAGDLCRSVFWLTVILSCCNLDLPSLPYNRAKQAWDKRLDSKGKPTGTFRKFFVDLDYIRKYREAVELSACYITAMFENYRKIYEGRRYTDRDRNRFLKIVSNADLVTPLKHGKSFLDQAISVLHGNSRSWTAKLRLKTSKSISRQKIPTALD